MGVQFGFQLKANSFFAAQHQGQRAAAAAPGKRQRQTEVSHDS
jgi:hypothetical protein